MNRKKVAYQGRRGSYSHECLHKNLIDVESVGYITFEGAISAVQYDNTDFALVPVENSIAGRVTDIHHLLARSGLNILAEFYHPINHCLIAKDGAKLDKIKYAYSHPMALAQCRVFLHKQNIGIVPYADTAEAAKYISEQDSLEFAAICAKTNIDFYKGLILLKEGIQDTQDNTTRFFLLAREDKKEEYLTTVNTNSKKQTKYITAIFYTVKNIPSALFKSLSGFATGGVNVTKLESFMPMHGNGAARFYIEIAGHISESSVQQALTELGHYASKVEVLGSFVSAS